MASITQTDARHGSQALANPGFAPLGPLGLRKAPRFPPLPVADRGKVRLGGQGPCFRPSAIADAGKVRIGGQGPIFR